jgi:hypothetical protein
VSPIVHTPVNVSLVKKWVITRVDKTYYTVFVQQLSEFKLHRQMDVYTQKEKRVA